jgi:hypothetical protein
LFAGDRGKQQEGEGEAEHCKRNVRGGKKTVSDLRDFVICDLFSFSWNITAA